MAADHNQTRQICASPKVHETNPLLGREPEPARVRNYFVASTILHAAITYALPTQYRAAWIAAGIAIEASVVHRNRKLGLRVAF